jgi:hypothetical protein
MRFAPVGRIAGLRGNLVGGHCDVEQPGFAVKHSALLGWCGAGQGIVVREALDHSGMLFDKAYQASEVL